MPVPVPSYTKQPAHPVVKSHRPGPPAFVHSSVFQHLAHSLPAPPSGPPPSFATREEWINSLPDWRRNKHRYTLQLTPRNSGEGFQRGLAAADNASVIKGAFAQAGIPPISTLIASADAGNRPMPSMYLNSEEDTDEEMCTTDEEMGWQSDSSVSSQSGSSGNSGTDMSYGRASDEGSQDDTLQHPYGFEGGLSGEYTLRHHDFSPVEDFPPELTETRNILSSPVGPATPFGEYVDRAVADAHAAFVYDDKLVPQCHYVYQDGFCGAQCGQCQQYAPVEQHAQQQAPDPVITPSASTSYKRLVEPLSEWVAAFVWKVCTTGMSLKSEYAQPSSWMKRYPSTPPSHLAKATHSMFLSTLLQPSGIFLALWYIVQLPVYFGPSSLGPEHSKEIRFRAELLGEAHMALDRDVIESYAPFRLVLLGCMMANKWLDDHTFSNKTWHTISNVPIRSLNMLESLALDLFEHNLSIPTDEWSRWLSQLLSYHVSLSSPAFPQPISRPSASPHTIIRKSLETLIEASALSCFESSHNAAPEPIFLGVEEQKKGSTYSGCGYDSEDIDVLEIDLDADGPLREEYLPRRRISAAGSMRSHDRVVEVDRTLPPPARWSPEADEPITRGQLRAQAHYVAPQPIAHIPVQAPPQPPSVPPPFHQALEVSRSIWPSEGYMHHYDPNGKYSYPPIFALPPPHPGFEYAYPTSVHSRSQSFSYSQPVLGQAQGHYRTLSQTRVEPGYSDIRFLDPRRAPPPPPIPSSWSHCDRPGYSQVYDAPPDYHMRHILKV